MTRRVLGWALGVAVVLVAAPAKTVSSPCRSNTESPTYRVTVNGCFVPSVNYVHKDTVVEWTNAERATHNIVGVNGLWTVGPIGPGESRSYRFTFGSGVYPYRCSIHDYIGAVAIFGSDPPATVAIRESAAPERSDGGAWYRAAAAAGAVLFTAAGMWLLAPTRRRDRESIA